jgi:hypothetical protein
MKTKLFLTVLTAVQLHFAAASPAGGDYVAHEWGTFTSVQGADGIQLEWNPLIVSDLPKFVYDRNRPHANAKPGQLALPPVKLGFTTLQRMETPVIYFYADQEQTVDVTVNFPQGIVTEWYPQIAPSTKAKPEAAQLGPKMLHWDKVRVLPLKQNEALAGALPVETSGSHYYAARETDAGYLHVGAVGESGTQAETEKFLFYRGVGNFRAPLTVTQNSDGESITLQNAGSEELRHLFVYRVHQGQGKFLYVKRLSPGGNETVKLQSGQNLSSLPSLRADIARHLQQALVKEGLFEREASAMVKTWDDSWFAEQGLRVLYTLPGAWTDRILPLTLEPKPREVVRVMVGRAELITPAMEWELMKQVVRFTDKDENIRVHAVEDARNLGLGRFLEPATRRLNGKMSSREFSEVSWELVNAVSKPAPELKKLAVK